MGHTPLGTDATTAFRLVMDEDGRASVSWVLAAWYLLDAGCRKRKTLDELPASYRREGDMLVSDEPHDPIALTPDEVIAEAFRLSSIRDGKDPSDWQLHSNISRSGHILARHTPLVSLHGGTRKFSAYVRESRHVQERMVGEVLWIRPAPGGLDVVEGRMSMAAMTALCPGDVLERSLGEFRTYTEARQNLLRETTRLVADGTIVTISGKGRHPVRATWNSSAGRWIDEEDQPILRIDLDEQPRHQYINGQWVGGLVGYVTVDRRDRIHANVGMPIDSPRDNDAMVTLQDRMQAESIHEAIDQLRKRGDLDRIFTKPTTVNGMGVWLTCLEDAPEETRA